jgi:hypothetical protein
MHNYIRLSLVLLSTYFHLKHLRLPVSGSKQIATDRRSRLGQVVFEELVIMKSAWGPDLCDMGAWNAAQVEGVDVFDFEEMLAEDVDCATWDDLYVGWGDDVLELDEEVVIVA